MKIFITGSTGFIGKNLIEYYSCEETFKFSRDMTIERELTKFKPDLIINSAAEIYDADKMWEPNVKLTHDCLEYVKNNPSCRMVQIGSSSEYGPLNRASSERDKINPIDMYQATKGAATILCQGYARNYKLNISIARPYSVYGKYEKPHRLFPRLWKAFIKGEEINLYQGYHDFIYILDFIRGIDILSKKDGEPYGDIVNFGSGVQHSNFDVLKLFENVTNRKAQINVVETMAKKFESNIWVCDTNYAYEKYGFKVNYNLEMGIRDFLNVANY